MESWGNSWTNIGTQNAATAYQNEIVNLNTDVETEYSAKIGLMYVSDYGYATSPENWTTNLDSYNGAAPKSTNWMYMGDTEWTISRNSDQSYYAFSVVLPGDVFNSKATYSPGHPHDTLSISSVRPTFFLESSIVLTGGFGTMSAPYRIS